MKRILRASKDTYITDRIVNNAFRSIDANVGHAGTLDLFKLAGESSDVFVGPYISGTNEPIELSRVLIKFDLDPLRALTGSILDLDNPTFRCELQLSDVLGGQTIPADFRLVLFPLSRSFDEGIGRDVISFEDIGACNFLTASVSGDTVVVWANSGANNLGPVGGTALDAVSSSFVVQHFVQGDEDLAMNVTSIVSSTLVGALPDHGFRLSFSGTHETDDRTLFVKRFASRHGPNTRIHPRIVASWDDSVQDHHGNFYFDLTGSLFMYNYHRGVPSNLAVAPVVTLTSASVSGTFSTFTSASLHSYSGTPAVGIYSATFAIASTVALLSGEILNHGSATFTETWTSNGVRIHERTLVVYPLDRSPFQVTTGPLKLNVTNMRASYGSTERVRFRIFAQDDAFDFRTTRLPHEAPSLIFDRMYWQLRDAIDNTIIFPFDTVRNSTRVSSDADGMFFELFMSDLDIGRVYTIDLMIDDGGNRPVFREVGARFRVDV